MEDLTRRLPGGPVGVLGVTSQNAGNQRHGDRAMTAPGTEPASPLHSMPGEITVHEPPEITAEAYDTPVLISADGGQPHASNADRSNPFTVDDGAGWRSGDDRDAPLPNMGARGMIRRGQWNTI